MMRKDRFWLKPDMRRTTYSMAVQAVQDAGLASACPHPGPHRRLKEAVHI
jgi:hypothetical protein